MRGLIRETAELAADFLESVPERPVFPRVELEDLRAMLGRPLPDGPSDARDVVVDLAASGSDAAVAIAGGRYFGFVIGGAPGRARGPLPGQSGSIRGRWTGISG
jgi:hypothetical protein